MNSAEITHGLVIDQPWIDLILSGKKVWEMRSQNTNKRGFIALIQKGTKRIVGVSFLEGVVGPFNSNQLRESNEFHCIPSFVYESPEYKWNFAWKLKGTMKLEEPIPYIHKSGAVIWVELDQDSRELLSKQLQGQIGEQKNQQAESKLCLELEHKIGKMDPLKISSSNLSKDSMTIKVPHAKDGTFFCEEFCFKNNGYTVGEKGNERRFDSYHEALQYLQDMPTAKWRRPNPKGNWGIVSAVDWKEVS